MSPVPYTLGRDQTMAEAERRMREHGIRHLAVLHGGAMIGIVSDRDIAVVQTLPGVDPDTVQVHEAMTPDPYAVQGDTPTAVVVATMAEHKYGAALVMDGDKLAGIFTTTDALRLASDLLSPSG